MFLLRLLAAQDHAIIVDTGLARPIINTAFIILCAMTSIQSCVISETHIKP